VALDPRLEHRIWLALCLAKFGVHDDAVKVMADATKAMPPDANAHFAAGMVYFALGQHEDAAYHYGKCIARDSARASAHYRYARSLHAAGRLESSIESYRNAIQHGSAEADHHADLSGALSDLGRFEEARAAGATAVSLDPACIVGHNNLGHALLCLNRSAEAATAYESAITMDPSYAKAQFGYATALLKSGDFERGWRQYEWRWRDCQTPREDLTVPLWQGEDLGGAPILLHAEQGFGDTLQFVRFAPWVTARGGCVVLEVPSPLVRLLRDVEGVTDVVAHGEPLPLIQWHCPMASLPLAFDLRLDAIPAEPYLPRPSGTSPRTNFVIGLAWAGDPRPSQPGANRVDQRRSTSLDVLAPLLDIPGIQFASFQVGPARGQIEATGLPVTDMMADVTDFADTAMRLADVDLLISVDTAIAHLAGAMGMPVWLLSRFDGCWRWLEARDDTPWYPSMRIFRQPSPGDWTSLIAEVGFALRSLGQRKPEGATLSPIHPAEAGASAARRAAADRRRCQASPAVLGDTATPFRSAGAWTARNGRSRRP
jgi:Flp pilus assembly protein TadD